jgi:general secretion pathway protein J
MNEHRTTAGFTLLELLVSLVVLGFLIAGLGQGLRLGLRVWEAQSRIVGTRDQFDAADRTLRELLTHIEPDTGVVESIRFSARPDRLDFRSELPSTVRLGTRRIDASLLVNGRRRLVLRWTPRLHERALGDPIKEQETELLDGIAQIEFRYWHAADANGRGGEWRREWSEPTLPDLIKVHLVFLKNDYHRWPDIVIAPALDLPGG